MTSKRGKPATQKTGLPQQLSKQVAAFGEQLKTLQGRAEGEIRAVEKRAKKSAALKNLQRWGKDMDKRLQKGQKRLDRSTSDLAARLLGSIGVASKKDVDKLQKKLNTLSRKLNGLSAA